MYQHLNLIAPALFILLFTNCRESQPKKELVDEKPLIVDTLSFEHVEKNLAEEQQSKIYKIEKKALVFFMIDRQEAKKMAHELGDSYRWETDALFNGFIDQSQTFGKLIKKHNIHSELAHNKVFQIILNNGSSVYFDRVKEDQIMGEILTDGKKEPLIRYGMYTSRELANLVQEFFEIENLGYVSPDTLELKKEEDLERDSVVPFDN